jgi:hypothetical protein
MIYKKVSGKYVRADLRADFPNTSFPSDLSQAVLPDGYIWVVPSPQPTPGPFELVIEVQPFKDSKGVWRQMWATQTKTDEEIQEILVSAIQQHLDATAQTRAYDGIISLCTYATSPSPKFAAEGQAGVEWRDACWAKGYEILAEYRKGLRQIPMPDELIAELPAMVWPE